MDDPIGVEVVKTLHYLSGIVTDCLLIQLAKSVIGVGGAYHADYRGRGIPCRSEGDPHITTLDWYNSKKITNIHLAGNC